MSAKTGPAGSLEPRARVHAQDTRSTLGVSMTWADLEVAAPEIARLGKRRLDQARLALLGTLGADGSPRISPVEPYLAQGHLLFGAMAWSSKTHDLLRDPRCVLHSAVSNPDSGEGELKLHGRAIEADHRIRDGCQAGWWIGRPSNVARVFSLDIDRAVFISWDTDHGELILRTWSPHGYRERTRTYP